MIVHSGDFSKRGTKQQVEDFLYWYNSLPYRYKIFIAGNHDFLFDQDKETAANILKKYPDLIYLENSSVTIEGIKFYGSPVSPWFHDWAFNVFRGAEIKKYWDMIPLDVNFLITHGPAHNILDKVNNSWNKTSNVGCADLKNRLFQLHALKIFQFGHIHEAFGYEMLNNIHCFNASSVDEDYMTRSPGYHQIEVDLSNNFTIKVL